MGEFNVSDYELQDTAEIILKDAGGVNELKGEGGELVKVEIYSPGSPEGVKALHRASRAAQLRMFRSMRGDFDKQDAVNADRERAEKLASFTKRFVNFPVAPLDVYANPRLAYISDQVDAAIGKYANFSKGSSQS